MKPIYSTRGNRKNPIHKHYWSDGSIKTNLHIEENDIDTRVKSIFEGNAEKQNSSASNSDGQEMRDFRHSLSTSKKDLLAKNLSKEELSEKRQTLKDFSRWQGELFGHSYVTEILGYLELFHGDNKTASMEQGLDSVYFDLEAKEIVVVEFKGQKSRLEDEQKDPNWTIDRCQKIQRGEGKYIQATEAERRVATQILDAYNNREKIRYEVVRTEVSERTGEFWSQLEKQTILEKPPTEKSENKAVVDKLYSKSKENSTDKKSESKSESKVESKSKSKKG